jgi:hypothetical protein
VVALDYFEDVAVHDEAEDGQEEDQADLDEALFHGDAEIAAEGAFDGEEQDVAAIEDWNWEKVEQAEVEADRRHEKKEREWAVLGGLA